MRAWMWVLCISLFLAWRGSALASSVSEAPAVSAATPRSASAAPPAVDGLSPPRPLETALPPAPLLTDAEASLEASRLRRALRSEVAHVVTLSKTRRVIMIGLARAEIAASGHTISRPQLVVVVDRAPTVQTMQIVAAYPDAPWEVIGGTHVSTGQSGRKLYYITPTGVFENSDAILGYRAQGTYNEHHIRGNGLKGMRVWDFGWHEAVKGWLPTGETGQIRLEVHATDPTFLEARIGRPASEGCVRIPSAMNRFLDVHGVLDVDYERAAAVDIRFRTLLLPDRQTSKLAGKMLVVIDSSGQRA